MTDAIPPFETFKAAFACIAEAAGGTYSETEIGALAAHAATLAEQSGQDTAIDGVAGMVRFAAAGRRAKLNAGQVTP